MIEIFGKTVAGISIAGILLLSSMSVGKQYNEPQKVNVIIGRIDTKLDILEKSIDSILVNKYYSDSTLIDSLK